MLHAAVGAGAQALLRTFLPPSIAMLICAGVAWGKERWDKEHPPADAEGWDAFSTLLGAVALDAAWTAVALAIAAA